MSDDDAPKTPPPGDDGSFFIAAALSPGSDGGTPNPYGGGGIEMEISPIKGGATPGATTFSTVTGTLLAQIQTLGEPQQRALLRRLQAYAEARQSEATGSPPAAAKPLSAILASNLPAPADLPRVNPTEGRTLTQLPLFMEGMQQLRHYLLGGRSLKKHFMPEEVSVSASLDAFLAATLSEYLGQCGIFIPNLLAVDKILDKGISPDDMFVPAMVHTAARKDFLAQFQRISTAFSENRAHLTALKKTLEALWALEDAVKGRMLMHLKHFSKTDMHPLELMLPSVTLLLLAAHAHVAGSATLRKLCEEIWQEYQRLAEVMIQLFNHLDVRHTGAGDGADIAVGEKRVRLTDHVAQVIHDVFGLAPAEQKEEAAAAGSSSTVSPTSLPFGMTPAPSHKLTTARQPALSLPASLTRDFRDTEVALLCFLKDQSMTADDDEGATTHQSHFETTGSPVPAKLTYQAVCLWLLHHLDCLRVYLIRGHFNQLIAREKNSGAINYTPQSEFRTDFLDPMLFCAHTLPTPFTLNPSDTQRKTPGSLLKERRADLANKIAMAVSEAQRSLTEHLWGPPPVVQAGLTRGAPPKKEKEGKPEEEEEEEEEE